MKLDFYFIWVGRLAPAERCGNLFLLRNTPIRKSARAGVAIGATLGSFGGGIAAICGAAYDGILAVAIYDGFNPVEFSNMVSSDPRIYCM